MANSANDWSLMFYKDPRSAVGMVEKGHYILLVADGRGIGGSLGLTRTEMQNIFKSAACAVYCTSATLLPINLIQKFRNLSLTAS